MTNPFENENGSYLVLINGEGQYSLWPAFLDAPAGWDIVYGEENREKCLDYIKSEWKHLMPNSLKTLDRIGNGK